jgi:hypothetical protein
MIDELEKLLDARIAADKAGGPAHDAAKAQTVL